MEVPAVVTHTTPENGEGSLQIQLEELHVHVITYIHIAAWFPGGLGGTLPNIEPTC